MYYINRSSYYIVKKRFSECSENFKRLSVTSSGHAESPRSPAWKLLKRSNQYFRKCTTLASAHQIMMLE